MLAFATFSIAGTEICFTLALLLFLSKKTGQRILKSEWKVFPSSALNLPVLCFLLASFLSTVFSIEPTKSLFVFIGKTLEYALIYFLLLEVLKAKAGGRRFEIVLTVLIGFYALSVLDGIFQHFQGVDFFRQRPLVNGYLTAAFKYYNDFGSYLILFLPLNLGLLFLKRSYFSIHFFLSLSLAMLAGLCLALTYSRGAWIGFICAFSLFFIGGFFYLTTSTNQKILFLLSVIALILLVFFLSPLSMKERAISIFHLESAGRLGKEGLWYEAMRLVKNKFLLGYGLGVYMDLSKGTYAHNCYLQMLAETGVVGIASFLWILHRLFTGGARIFRKSKDPLLLGILTGIIGFLIHSVFDTNLYSLQLSVLFWAMLALAIVRMEMVLEERRI